MKFDENNFTKKKYKNGTLYFVKNFNFQNDIPDRKGRKQKDFCGKSALLEFSEREYTKIYITNKNLELSFAKISDDKYLVDITKFSKFYNSLKNKTNFDLAHAFFTNCLDIRTANLSNKDYSEILKRDDFKKFLKENISAANGNNISSTVSSISDVSASEIYLELKRRNLDYQKFFEFAESFLTDKQDLKISDLQKLTRAIDLKKIEAVLKIWEENKANQHEVKFWQKFLKNNPWIISQIFSAPYAIFQNEFYTGGQYSGSTKGAKITDFGYKNKFSQSIAIIEIKTPMTNLVEKKEYDGRGGIHPMNKKLMGSISQILIQKDSLQKDFLQNNKEKDFNVWNPKAILIIGSEDNENLSSGQRACFELFKNSQKDIEIITFDELFEKIKNLKNLFSKSNEK
ncbi:MAG: DUF4263 domain-containing protein [Candidatus Berkelbacteria bacterium]|nr:DUF4263 domain-containing protein [Candidatus Berkelbacteria bacterium]